MLAESLALQVGPETLDIAVISSGHVDGARLTTNRIHRLFRRLVRTKRIIRNLRRRPEVCLGVTGSLQVLLVDIRLFVLLRVKRRHSTRRIKTVCLSLTLVAAMLFLELEAQVSEGILIFLSDVVVRHVFLEVFSVLSSEPFARFILVFIQFFMLTSAALVEITHLDAANADSVARRVGLQ